jgi:two-component system phosphate regulon sensor histidine kinase PhoR
MLAHGQDFPVTRLYIWETMASTDLEQLAVLIKSEREALLARWRQDVRQMPSARHLNAPTLNDHIPGFLEDLATALAAPSGQTTAEAMLEGRPPAHGVQRVEDGFDIVEVVAEYSILRYCIHDLAESHGLQLQGESSHVVDRVLDRAIALAVKTFAAQRALEVQRRREDYLAFVAHDLRTPLSAISLALDVLERTHSPQSAQSGTDQMLKVLHRNVMQLKVLVEKVLEENLNLQTEIGVKVERRAFDLWPQVEALVLELHPLAGRNSTRVINDIPDDIAIYADAGLLKRVFQNLIANAIKYTPRGKIHVGAKDLGADVGVECWVTDNGAGIPAASLERVFDKGETDPESDDGTGLGLAVVKTFVEAHGGQITVESKQGSGSTFRFRLPSAANVSGFSQQSGQTH